MKEWLVTHPDAVVPIVIGILVCVTGFSKRDSPVLEDARKRRKLHVWGSVLIAIGIFRIIGESITKPPAIPVTATTDDGIASIVFPQEPVRTEAIDEAAGIKIPRETRACSLRGVDLRLSYSGYPPGVKDMPVEVRLANLKEHYKQLGDVFVGSSVHPGPVHELVFDMPKENSRLVARFWFGPEGIYRALATTGKGHYDDPRAVNFISSFRITAARPEK